MHSHVKILAWFNIVLGLMGALAAAVVYGGSMILVELVRVAIEEAGLPADLLQLAAFIITAVVLAASLPCLLVGWGLLNLRPWARVLGLVMAALNLLHVPIGTIISIYAFWVLLKPETEALFKPAPR